jgi:uncharacterized repeat protein (TIGR03847 family)
VEPFDYDLDPVSFITVGTEGPPGERTFYLQAAQGGEVVSLVLEKEHAAALAEALSRLLASLAAEDPAQVPGLAPAAGSMALLTPVRPAFRIAQMGVGVDEERQVIVLIAQEGDDEAPGQRARFIASYGQVASLAEQAEAVIHQGRPICPLCGGPMDPEGHFCPRQNGHHQLRLEE